MERIAQNRRKTIESNPEWCKGDISPTIQQEHKHDTNNIVQRPNMLLKCRKLTDLSHRNSE